MVCDKQLLTTEEAAEYLTKLGFARSPRTLVHWRATGQGPLYMKMTGGAVRYTVKSLDKFFADQVAEDEYLGAVHAISEKLRKLTPEQIAVVKDNLDTMGEAAA